MHRFLLLLWLVSFPACLGIRQGLRLNIASKDFSDAKAEGFNFHILNNSSLPLNILALPKALRVYAASSNNVQPGQSFNLVAVMGAYDFDVTIHDGENGYNNYGQAGWGLLKDGTTVIVATAAGAGLTGTLAISAAAIVTATLTSWAIAPTAIVAGTVATFLGVAVMSSMAVSALTETSMDFALNRFEKLLKNHGDDIKGKKQLQNDSSVHELHDEAMFKFNLVVTETPVREAFLSTFPHLDLEKVIMDKATAHSYFKSMQSQFSDWKIAKGATRTFAIAGGFMNPVPVDLEDDSSVEVGYLGAAYSSVDFTRVSFAPLALGEINSGYGCNLAMKATYWREHAKQCEEACISDLVSENATQAISKPWWRGGGAKPMAEWPEEEQLRKASCVGNCIARFKEALDSERQVAESEAKLRDLRGQELFPVGTIEQLSKASRAAGISKQNDEFRTAALQIEAVGTVTEVDVGRGAARMTVHMPAGKAGKMLEIADDLWYGAHPSPTLAKDLPVDLKLWFPFESLSAVPGGAAIYSLTQRVAPEPRYGECWSKCGATDGAKRVWDNIISGLKQVVTVGGVGKWCLASDAIEETMSGDISLSEHIAPPRVGQFNLASELEMGGRVCTSHDDCGHVRNDEEWHCTDSCS